MIDPNESTCKVEPFDAEAWIAFASKDRFLTFQMREFEKRVAGMNPLTSFGSPEAMLATYLEAQYNGCHEDSVLARKWNAFVKRRADAAAKAENDANMRHEPDPFTGPSGMFGGAN